MTVIKPWESYDDIQPVTTEIFKDNFLPSSVTDVAAPPPDPIPLSSRQIDAGGIMKREDKVEEQQ